MENSNNRQSNIELFRIISIGMVIGLHYFNGSMGGAISQQTPSQYNYYITYLLESMFIVSVNCFILITGYFQIGKTSIKINKVIELIVLMVFYSVLFYTVGVAVGVKSFNLKEIAGAIFPRVWFLETYIILYILSPFINIGLNKMDKREYKIYLIIMLFFFSVCPSFLPKPPVTDRGYGIITFVLLYSLGAYIKRFYEAGHSAKYYFERYILCSIITFLFIVIFPGKIHIVWGYNFVFTIIGSMFLFIYFSKLNIKSRKINYISTFTFGVYLIHGNAFKYKNILHCDKYWFSPFFIIHAIISIVMIYIVATVIDIFRKWSFDKIWGCFGENIKNSIPILWMQIP